MDVLIRLLEHIDIFLLIFARILGMFLSVPIFNSSNIPIHIKVGLSLIISMILFPIIQIPTEIINQNLYALLFSSIKEILFGIMIGFICYLFFSSLYLAGHLIDMEMGFAIVNVINPQDDTEIPLVANLFYVLASLIFLSINAHHTLIYALEYSFKKIPLGLFNINPLMLDQLVEIITFSFVIGFKMAAPILITLFISNVLLGILARTMPQMNAFMIGLPLKILLGLIMLALTAPLYIPLFEYIFGRMFETLNQFFDIILY